MQNKIKKINVKIENQSIWSEEYNEFYFHSEDGVNESNYVFLNTNNLKKRFRLCDNFLIAELGFGTGLNFLNTWKLWQKEKKENACLNYVSFEKQPLTKDQLNKILKNFNSLKNFSNLLLNNLPLRTSGIHELYFSKENIKLTLVYDDFDYLKKLNFHADTWFLDGFSPSKNRSAWSIDLMKQVFKNTKIDGTFATFTSASNVQKNLKLAGFKVFKKKGFKKKREMIFGIKNYLNKPFLNLNSIKNQYEPVAIVGSGISGCSLAYSLKKRNIKCFILEKNKSIGNGASGNLVALQLPKLTLDISSLGVFSLRSYFYSRNLALYLNSVPFTEGVLVAPSREREEVKFEKILLKNWHKNLFHKYEGNYNFDNKISLLYPNAGIVDTKKFLKKLSGDTKFFYNFEVKEVIDDGKEKKIVNQNGDFLKASSIIWANGYEIDNKLKNNLVFPVSGQVTYLNENSYTKDIKMNFSYGNFFSQSYTGVHQIGSTFSRDDFLPSRDNNKKNIDNLPVFLKRAFDISEKKDFKSRFSIRASTKDRLPFFGSLNDIREFYLGGMGSWGFIYAPFLAEILIRRMFHEPIILEDFVLRSLDLEMRI